jgi:thioredoxin reductase
MRWHSAVTHDRPTETTHMNRKTLILGGGIVGVAAFISLVRHRASESIDIVNPGPIGLGRAFATTESTLLTNTSVDTLSILADDKEDFLRYLHSRGVPAVPGTCVPRYYVSQYARDRYDQYAQIAREAGIGLRHVRGTAVEIRMAGRLAYQVRLDSGEVVEADNVLVCCGFAAPLVPDPIRPHVEREGIFTTPYPESALLTALSGYARVLVLGTRLSAIDAALLLCGQGHNVTMASRSGELPAVRTQLLRGLTGRVDRQRFAVLDIAGPRLRRQLLRLICGSARITPHLPVSRQVSRSRDIEVRLREEIQLAERTHNNWQNIIIELLDLANTALIAAGPDTQKHALDRCWDMVQRYLFSFPLGNAKALLNFIENGKLKIRAGTPENVVRTPEGWAVSWLAGDTQLFDAVVCATGFHRPRFHVKANALEIVTDAARAAETPRMTADLRVILRGSNTPENIWLVGVSSYLRSALVSIVYQGAQQADAIASSLAQSHAKELAGVSSER